MSQTREKTCSDHSIGSRVDLDRFPLRWRDLDLYDRVFRVERAHHA